MALLQGWSGRIGKKKLKHIWKKNKSLRLLFMTEWKPLVISRKPCTWTSSRMSTCDVMQPCAFRWHRPKLKRTVVTSSSPTIGGYTDESHCPNLSISNRAYADLGHEVDSGKGMKTVVLRRDTSWIDYCSACGKLDALEYYHVGGCYKLCSQSCFRDYIQRRRYIISCSQNTIFSRKSLQTVGTSDQEITKQTMTEGTSPVSKTIDLNNVDREHKITGNSSGISDSKCDSQATKPQQHGETMTMKTSKMKKSKFSIPLRIALKSCKHHKKKSAKMSPKKCIASDVRSDVKEKPSENTS